MPTLSFPRLELYIAESVREFHQARLAALAELKLDQLLRRKNPYLFRSKNLETSGEFVLALIDDHISSAGETQFGNFLEGLAIHVAGQVHGGYKSGIPGIDLELDADGERNIVAIKSGPNWGNSSQIAKMRLDFQNAARTLRTSNSKVRIRAINGCCYGRDDAPDKGGHFKLCGERFWTFLSNEESLYIDLIKPLGGEAQKHGEAFRLQRAAKINLFSTDFGLRFCANGPIDWEALVRFNSGARTGA